MRALIQRVARAAVAVEDKEIARIGKGMLVFLGIAKTDSAACIDSLVEKICNLRVFDDAQGKMNVSGPDAGAEFLVISQFTLYADCRKGRRPGFDAAARPEQAKPLYEEFLKKLSAKGPKVQGGVFQALMQVELVNDGPVTLMLDTDA